MNRFAPMLLVFFVGLMALGLFVSSCDRSPSGSASSNETMPPKPSAYFNDYAGVVSKGVSQQLDAKLRQFERETSNQIVVAIFPEMQSDSSIEDYTQRIADLWKVGQADRDNGAVLFVFVKNRELFIQTGYGLEGALPDALAKQIIENDIVPQLRGGDWNGAMSAGVDGMVAATRGEYTGTGRVAGDGRREKSPSSPWFFIFIVIIFILSGIFRGRRGYGYGRGGYGPIYMGGFGRGGRGGGFGGGFGGGGGFSGGGGSFGGGGAGGRW